MGAEQRVSLKCPAPLPCLMGPSRGGFTNVLPLHRAWQTQLAFFGDDLAPRKNSVSFPFTLALPSLPPTSLFLFSCKQSTSFPRYYLFLTGFNKAGPKEETTTQLPKLSPAQH